MGPLPDISFLFWFGLFGAAVAVIGGLGFVGWMAWHVAYAIVLYNGWV